jgi:hypothetical protein
MAMTFPEWAPKPLVEYYRNHVKTGRVDMWKGWEALFERLLTYPRMEPVWREITKRIKSRLDGIEVDFAYLVLVANTTIAVEHCRNKDIYSRQEEIARYQSIAKQARALSRTIKGSALDAAPYRWYSDSVIGEMIGQLRVGEEMEGSFCDVEPFGDGDKETVHYDPLIKEINGKSVLRLPAKSKLDFLMRHLRADYPTISSILVGLAKDADDLAKRAAKEHRLIGKPGAENTQRLVFIREMARIFKSEFGSPLYRTLAGLSSVVLEDETIDQDTVRDALRGGWEIIDD